MSGWGVVRNLGVSAAASLGASPPAPSPRSICGACTCGGHACPRHIHPIKFAGESEAHAASPAPDVCALLVRPPIRAPDRFTLGSKILFSGETESHAAFVAHAIPEAEVKLHVKQEFVSAGKFVGRSEASEAFPEHPLPAHEPAPVRTVTLSTGTFSGVSESSSQYKAYEIVAEAAASSSSARKAVMLSTGKFEGTTTSGSAYVEQPLALREPIRPSSSPRSALKFTGSTTSASDFVAHAVSPRSPSSPRAPRSVVSTGRFEGSSTAASSWVAHALPPPPSPGPASPKFNLSSVKFEGVSTSAAAYTEKTVEVQSPRRAGVAPARLESLRFSGSTESRDQFTAKSVAVAPPPRSSGGTPGRGGAAPLTPTKFEGVSTYASEFVPKSAGAVRAGMPTPGEVGRALARTRFEGESEAHAAYKAHAMGGAVAAQPALRIQAPVSTGKFDGTTTAASSWTPKVAEAPCPVVRMLRKPIPEAAYVEVAGGKEHVLWNETKGAWRE